MTSQSTYYEADWERLSARQVELYRQSLIGEPPNSILTRDEFRLGAASTVQKALQSLGSKDLLDVYKGNYFFIDTLFAHWIRRRGRE